MRWRQLYPWFVGEMTFFALLHMVLFFAVLRTGTTTLPLDPMRLVLLGMAVFRMAHILSNEKITKPLRSLFVTTHEEDGKEIETSLTTGLRGAIGELLCCPSCTGIWVATFLVYGYLLFPLFFSIVILVLASSTAERFLTMSFDNMKAKKESPPPPQG